MVTVTGVNHITFAVSDLEKSFDFYTDVLGFSPTVRWSNGAYLRAGNLWLALVTGDHSETSPEDDYSHIALDCT